MAIDFQNACILSFWKLFQCFQKIWKINTTLFPKLVLIFLKSLCGSQNGFPNLESGSEPIAPPHYWTSAALCSVRGERNSKSSEMKITVTPTWHHQLVEISQYFFSTAELDQTGSGTTGATSQKWRARSISRADFSEMRNENQNPKKNVSG